MLDSDHRKGPAGSRRAIFTRSRSETRLFGLLLIIAEHFLQPANRDPQYASDAQGRNLPPSRGGITRISGQTEIDPASFRNAHGFLRIVHFTLVPRRELDRPACCA